MVSKQIHKLSGPNERRDSSGIAEDDVKIYPSMRKNIYVFPTGKMSSRVNEHGAPGGTTENEFRYILY